MRVFSLIAVALLVSSFASPVHAGMVEVCEQKRDWGLRIEGCTAVILSGEWEGLDLIWAYNNRGLSYRKLEEYLTAIENYDQVIRIDPGNVYAFESRAWTLYLMGRNADALIDVEQALSLGPGDAWALSTRAHILAALGRWDEARVEYERSLQAAEPFQMQTYQEALMKHGYYRGVIDGFYGPQVRAALVACLAAKCRVLE